MDKYSKLSLVHPDEEIKLKFKRDEILKIIFEEANKYVARKYFTSPTDIRLVRFISLLLENLVKKKHKIDKKELFIELLKLLYPSVSENEITHDIDLIEDLLKSKQIKKIPVLKYAVHLAYEFAKDFTYNFFLQKI
jgi:hypothetical protein